MTQRFPLAPMCPIIRTLTLALAFLPMAFAIATAFWARALAAPTVLVVLAYAWIWTRFRPTAFVVHPDALEVVWPLKRRRIARAEISAVRLLDRRELRELVGWGTRVGAGGLWGGFGWLWTTRRGIVQMYVSRLDRFVWIERGGARPWLITPDEPAAFARSLGG
jgi:hypothetical protein